MADVTRTKAKGSYADAGILLAMTAATNADQVCETYKFGVDTLLALNTGAGSHTVTVYSSADETGRTNDLSESIGAGAIRLYGPFEARGFRQTDGKLKIKGNNAEIKFAVIAGD